MKRILKNRWLVLLPATLLVFALVASACGDDDDDDDDSGSSGGGSDEEQYVRGLCNAINGFQEDLDGALGGLDDVDEDTDLDDLIEDVVDSLIDTLDGFVDDVDDLDPPSDMEDFHNSAVSQFEDIKDAVDSDDFDFLGDEDPFGAGDEPDLPSQEVQDKYQAIAANEPACEGTDIFSSPGA